MNVIWVNMLRRVDLQDSDRGDFGIRRVVEASNHSSFVEIYVLLHAYV